MNLQAFEDRHPVIKQALSRLSVDSITHAERVAVALEGAAREIATILPDGFPLEHVLDKIEDAQRHALSAIAEVVAAADPHKASPAGDAPFRGQELVPGRDYPITHTPTIVPPAPSGPTVGEPDQAAQEAPTEPVKDSGPLGVIHKQEEDPVVPF